MKTKSAYRGIPKILKCISREGALKMGLNPNRNPALILYSDGRQAIKYFD